MAYHFLVKTITSFRLAGESYRFQEVGAVVSFPAHLGKMIHEKQASGTEHLVLRHIDPEDLEVTASESLEEQTSEATAEETVGESTTEKEEEKKEGDPAKVEVPLAANTHWSTVKSFLLKMEEESNILMVQAIKEKFPQYSAIQEEADRILAEAK